MTTQEDYEELIISVDERTKAIPGIEKHLKTLNGSIADTNTKLAKTEQIAKDANKKGDRNTKTNVLFAVVLIAGLFTLLAQVL